ncbi:MAG: helix-turn-helix domain-containing protein [Oscillospiraceae bacterium]|nr:helix-turn-helix domain-containing protein [Oscillospiraceae bacterium]
MQNYNSESINDLFRSILLLQNEDECRAFFEDLCTIKELQDMAQRLETARLLSEGKNYQEISREVGISSTTISRVSRCLNYGGGGYETVISRLGGREKQR